MGCTVAPLVLGSCNDMNAALKPLPRAAAHSRLALAPSPPAHLRQEIIHVDTSLGMLERARSHAAASSSGRAHPPTRYVHWQPDSEVLPLEPASADCEWDMGRGCLLWT